EAPYDLRRSLEQQLATVRAALEQNAKVNETFMRNLRLCFRGMLGAENPALSTYGIKPVKQRRPLTSDEQTLAVARAKATRQKRGTLGKDQKAAIQAPAPSSVTVVRDGSGANAATVTPPQAQGGGKT